MEAKTAKWFHDIANACDFIVSAAEQRTLPDYESDRLFRAAMERHLEICTESDHREPELFALLRRAFGFLSENDPNLRAVSHFETELARIAGVHDSKMLKSDPAFALGNLFGRLPLTRTPLLKALAVTT
jgi:hypothetical protein